jgi:hypothetical protein
LRSFPGNPVPAKVTQCGIRQRIPVDMDAGY